MCAESWQNSRRTCQTRKNKQKLIGDEAIVRNHGVWQRSALKKRGHGTVKVIVESFCDG